MQEPLAQFRAVAETLSAIYHCDITQLEEIFKRSAIVRTNWASHVILLNSKLPLGERYWYITQAVANGWKCPAPLAPFAISRALTDHTPHSLNEANDIPQFPTSHFYKI